MRRGQIFMVVMALLASAVAASIAAPGALAEASPQAVCTDLADGRLDGNYSSAEIANATAQGYCSLIVIVTQPAPCTEVAPNTPGAVQAPNGKWYIGPNPQMCGPATPPAPQPCTEVVAGTPGSVQAPNGKYYTNVPNGNAEVCGPAAPAAQVCTEVAANTPGSVQAPNGKWYTNAPNGDAKMCGPAAAAAAPQVCTEVAANTPGSVQAPNGKWYTNAPNGNAEACGPASAPVATPVVESGTLPAQATKVTPAAKTPQPQAVPAAGVAGEQSPLRATKRPSGTLPFTGAELILFAIVGAVLIGAGLLLRASGRENASS